MTISFSLGSGFDIFYKVWVLAVLSFGVMSGIGLLCGINYNSNKKKSLNIKASYLKGDICSIDRLYAIPKWHYNDGWCHLLFMRL